MNSLTAGAGPPGARRDLIRWIEGWFNSRRLHSSSNYNSPIDWENLYYRRGDGIAA